MTVRAKSAYPIHADVAYQETTIGTCTVTQEFVIDFTGAEAVLLARRSCNRGRNLVS